MDAPHTKRARQRAATIGALKDEARRQLAEVGAQALSLRSVARARGMVSSAVYRYFESRDALLTALIIDAYDDLGAAVEEAAAAVTGQAGLGDRWAAACGALRAWAVDHPHEWALVYGSPVPGYAAPQDTTAPAARVPAVLLGLAAQADAARAGEPTVEGAGQLAVDPVAGLFGAAPGVLPAKLRTQAETVNQTLGLHLPAERVVAVTQAWTLLLGTVSLELFGQYVGTFDPTDALYQRAVETAGRLAGVPS